MRILERLDRHRWESRLDDLVRDAGRAILAYYRKSDLGRREKADQSPVTEADMAAHGVLLAGLSRLAADVPVVSEEAFEGDEGRAAAVVAAEPAYWLVDPLDGTRDFIAANDEFTVNVALMEGGRPVAGWLYAPALDLLYKAVAGRGTSLSAAGGDFRGVAARRADPSAPTVLVSRFHGRGEAEALRERIPAVVVTAVGSSLKYARIAEGAADATVRRTPTMLWDTAAADVILAEAGGRILGWDGLPLDYKRQSLTNPPFLALGDPRLDGLAQFGFLVGME